MKRLLVFVCCVLWGSWSASAVDLDQIQIHGFASQGYLRSTNNDYLRADTKDGTIEFSEVGFNITSKLTDRLRVGMQVLSRDLGSAGNDTLGFDWASIDYRYRNWLGARFGIVPRAFGLYNQIRDIDAARNSVFLPLSVYDETQRGFLGMKGATLYGSLPGGFDYQIQYGAFGNDSDASATTTSRFEVKDNSRVLYLEWNTPLDGLKLYGMHNYQLILFTRTSNNVETTSESEMNEWFTGWEYSWRNLLCAAEWNEYTFDNGQSESTGQRYYGSVNYRITDWLALGTSYAVSYGDKDDKEGERYVTVGRPKALAWYKDLALSARFDMNEYWLFKLEGHWINGLKGASNYDQENPDEDGFLFAAKITASF